MKITKLPLTIIFLLLLTSSALSVQTNTSSVENNLYYRALFASLEKMDKEWGKFADTAMGSRIRINYHNMIVEKNPYITERLPDQHGDYRVEYLESKELIDRYKMLRKEFDILVAYPMVNEGERLKITFNVYWMSYKKSHLFYALSDWSTVYFCYDCGKRKYVVDEIKLGGI